MGRAECNMMPSVVRRLSGHCSIGPSDVDDQSNDRMISPISPLPRRKPYFSLSFLNKFMGISLSNIALKKSRPVWLIDDGPQFYHQVVKSFGFSDKVAG